MKEKGWEKMVEIETDGKISSNVFLCVKTIMW